MEDLYKAHQKLIFAVAHRFAQPGLDLDELVSIGNLIFTKCLTRYNEEHNNGACFSTYLYSTLYWRFYNEAQSIHRQKTGTEVESLAKDDSHNPHRLLRLKQALSDVTSDAKDIIHFALYAPSDAIENFPKLNKSAIRKYFLSIWSGEGVQNRISDAFKEISIALENL